jgi:hypothetical protein
MSGNLNTSQGHVEVTKCTVQPREWFGNHTRQSRYTKGEYYLRKVVIYGGLKPKDVKCEAKGE